LITRLLIFADEDQEPDVVGYVGNSSLGSRLARAIRQDTRASVNIHIPNQSTNNTANTNKPSVPIATATGKNKIKAGMLILKLRRYSLRHQRSTSRYGASGSGLR
jgi:hypothetical protein